MWSTNTFVPPVRGYADPTKPAPNLPTVEDQKADDLLLFSLLGHKPPTKDELLKYKPRDWNKLEHLESFVTMRQSQLSSELERLRSARARALLELEKRLFLACPTRTELESNPDLASAFEAEKEREHEIFTRRWNRMEQLVTELAWREILEKKRQIKRIIADPQPKNYPSVRVPRGWEELRAYPEYMQLDFVRLLLRHVDGQLFKSVLRDSRWHKDKEVADFNPAREEYQKDRLFREYLNRNFQVVRDW